MRLKSKDLALISILAALYVIIAALPGIPIIGGKGRIDLAASIAPIFGILLGPWKGGLTALIGVLLAWLLPPGAPSLHSAVFIPAPVLSSLTTGFLTTRERLPSWIFVGLLKRLHIPIFVIGGLLRRLPNWVLASCILGGLIVCWYLTWVGKSAPLYPIPHLVALFITIVVGNWLSGSIGEGHGSRVIVKRSLVVPIVSYCGLMADHMYGNLAFITFAGLFMPLKYIPLLPIIFMSVLPISVIERLLMTLIASIIGVPLIIAYRIVMPQTE